MSTPVTPNSDDARQGEESPEQMVIPFPSIYIHQPRRISLTDQLEIALFEVARKLLDEESFRDVVEKTLECSRGRVRIIVEPPDADQAIREQLQKMPEVQREVIRVLKDQDGPRTIAWIEKQLGGRCVARTLNKHLPILDELGILEMCVSKKGRYLTYRGRRFADLL